MAELIALTLIARDEACQPRATTHLDLIEEYATALLDGAQFPAITLFDDGETYWLADGYHRLDAAEAACRAEILADIRLGTRRDAILFSLGANAAHGLRRTNEDKRRAVLTMLRDEEWVRLPDREISRQCGVDNSFVSRLRRKLSVDSQQIPRTVTRGGTTYEMDTTCIGGRDGHGGLRVGSVNGNDGWRHAADRRAEISRPDTSNAYIFHATRELLAAIEKMPSPEQAVKLFPEWAEYSIDTSAVNDAAQWLSQFAACWAEDEAARLGRIRKAIDLIKEAAVHVAQ